MDDLIKAMQCSCFIAKTNCNCSDNGKLCEKCFYRQEEYRTFGSVFTAAINEIESLRATHKMQKRKIQRLKAKIRKLKGGKNETCG